MRKALPKLNVLCSARNEFHNLSQREKARRFRRAPFDQQPWFALDDSAAGSQALMWLAQLLPLEQVSLRFSGPLMVRSACAQRLGLAVLPCFLGDAEPGLVRMGEPLPKCDSELWKKLATWRLG